MTLTFGVWKGHELSTVPDGYLTWITNSDLSNQLFGDPWGRDKFRIDDKVQLAAREELQRRGYKRKGMHWEK